MRCPNCNKFVSLELGEPELQDISYDRGVVTISVRIVRTCADCGEELKEAILDMEHQCEIPEEYQSADLGVEEDGIESTEEGGGRYKKSYFGAIVTFKVTTDDGKEVYTGETSDSVAASYMDELV